MTKLLEIVNLVCGIVGALMVSSNVMEGFIVFLISSIAGTIHAYRIGTRYVMLLNLFFTITNLNGIRTFLL